MGYKFGLWTSFLACLIIYSEATYDHIKRHESDTLQEHIQELLDLLQAQDSMNRNRRVPLSNLDLGMGSRLWSVANIGNRLLERDIIRDPGSPGRRRRDVPINTKKFIKS